MIKQHVLLITSNMSIYYSIKMHMENEGMDVYCMSFSTDALDNFSKQEYCLIIVDLPLDKNSLEMLHTMRKVSFTPILVITQPLTPDEKVWLLHAGANAYIEKPVDIAVCVAQSRALVQLFLNLNYKCRKCDSISFGTELIISPLYRQVIVDGILLNLTRTEFDLLFCLAQNPGQIWSRNQLYSYIWTDTLGLDGEHTVKTHIGNLKKKLSTLGKNYIQNSRGIGYKFVPPDCD